MNILIIDDNQIDIMINNRVVKNVLPEAHVRSCISAVEAIQYLDELSKNQRITDLPDLILLDIRMPMMDGFEFLEKLEEMPILTHKVPNIIMVTSSIDPVDLNKSNQHKLVKGFIGKPLKLNSFKEILEKLNF